MLLNKTTIFLTIIFIGLFLFPEAISGAGQDNKAARAFQLFDEKNYAEAEPLFRNLIEEKPELLLLYYYYGACRTENKKYSEYDLIQLLNANPNEAPAKINYYLGIQYQALNNWEQAIRYYNLFKLKSQPEEQAELNLAEKIQQCYNQENPFEKLAPTNQEDQFVNATPEAEPSLAGSTLNPEISDSLEIIEKEKTGDEEFPAVIQPEQEKKPKVKTIEFRVNGQITYFSPEQFKTGEGKSFFEKGQEKQNELNETLKKIESLRNEYQIARGSEVKNSIGQQIIPLETSTYNLKEEVTQFFLQAENAENNYWKNASEEEIENFINDQGNFEVMSDEKELQQNTEKDTVTLINPSLLFQERTETVAKEKPKTDELIYKIQIGAYSRALPAHVDRLFKKLAVLRKIENYTDEKGVVVYTTGNLANIEDAEKMLLQVKQEGAEDAVIVPYFNGKRITLEEAKKIESNL